MVERKVLASYTLEPSIATPLNPRGFKGVLASYTLEPFLSASKQRPSLSLSLSLAYIPFAQ
jgi:hypothetical protein